METGQIVDLVMAIVLLVAAALYFWFWKFKRKDKPDSRTIVLNSLLVGVGLWYAWDFIETLL